MIQITAADFKANLGKYLNRFDPCFGPNLSSPAAAHCSRGKANDERGDRRRAATDTIAAAFRGGLVFIHAAER